jgi:toxin ParE1/3/4
MSGWQLSRRARADLAEIWRYTFSRWGRDQADQYVKAIYEAFGKLLAKPSLGRPFPDAAKHIRKYRVGSHVIFYRKTRARMYIVRVLHQSMDYVRHLR